MRIIGHRGARNEAPENTVSGFVHAHSNGCINFELDIQLSSDGELVVYHDRHLDRTSGRSGQIKHTPYSILKEIDSRTNTPGWHSPCYIPHLEEVLTCVPPFVSWQLEVKSDHRHVLKIIIKQLQKLFYSHNLYNRATVTSSNRWILMEIKRLSPEIRTGYVGEYRYRRPLKTALALGCNLIAIKDGLVSRSLVEKAQSQGLEVSCWTVNQLERMETLKNMGVESVITDIPSKAIQHFGSDH